MPAPPLAQRDAPAVFGRKVADYLAARPDYPAALFAALAARVPPGPASEVADVGAGTGLLTAGLLALGYRTHAVEPNAAMRQAAQAQLGAHPGLHLHDGRAEALPLQSQSQSLITAAQAFHWFDLATARAEFQRVLKPGGWVALIWNDRRTEAPLHQAMNPVFAEFGGELRPALLAHEERARVPEFFEGAQCHTETWPHQHALSPAGLEALAFSRSYMPARDTPAGREAARQIAAIAARFQVDGAIEVPYQTVAVFGRWDGARAGAV